MLFFNIPSKIFGHEDFEDEEKFIFFVVNSLL
jgi:hypothetical protein